MPTEEFQKIINETTKEWNTAEEAVKIAENIDGDVVIPAILELRYAGRRLVDALSMQETDTEEAIALARDAKFFCHRARHDAIDAATSKMAGDLAVAVEYLSAQVVMNHFSDFPTLYRNLLNVREKVAVSRKDRENRDLIYETIQTVDLVKLSEVYTDFRTCEPLMVQTAEKEKRETRRNKIKGNAGLALGVFGIGVSVVLWFLA